jgi:hypothetical protein
VCICAAYLQAPPFTAYPADCHCALQVGFKRDLIKEVHAFVADAQAFRRDWEANGPMVPGLDPMDAVDRLKKFQQMFEVSSCPCAAAAEWQFTDAHHAPAAIAVQ